MCKNLDNLLYALFQLFLVMLISSLAFMFVDTNPHYTDVKPIECDIANYSIDRELGYRNAVYFILKINYENCNVAGAGTGTIWIDFRKEEKAEEAIGEYDGKLQAYVYTPEYDVHLNPNLITYQWLVIFGIITSSIYFIGLAIYKIFFYKKPEDSEEIKRIKKQLGMFDF